MCRKHHADRLRFAVPRPGLVPKQVERSCGAVGGVQLQRQCAEQSEFDDLGGIYLGNRGSSRKSSVRITISSSAACRHGPSPVVICNSSSLNITSEVGARVWWVPPLPTSSTPATSTPAISSLAAAVTST